MVPRRGARGEEAIPQVEGAENPHVMRWAALFTGRPVVPSVEVESQPTKEKP